MSEHEVDPAEPPIGRLPADPTWLVVDVMNVVGSRPDGWWHDRVGAAARLVARLRTLAAATGRQVTAVVDGEPDDRLPDDLVGGVDVVHAGRGRDAADDLIVVLLDRDDRAATVVTADLALAERARDRGATVVGPTSLRADLPPEHDGD